MVNFWLCKFSDKDSLEVPAIYLNKCCYIKPPKPSNFKDLNGIVKVEPLENDSSVTEFSVNDESCFLPMGFTDNFDEPMENETPVSFRICR